MKLHLGCGKSSKPGFVGVDIVPSPQVDVEHDLTVFPYPFEDNSVSEVLMSNILEHLPDTIKVMEELWRLCKDGAKVHIVVPYYNSPGASQDPTHLKFFTENTFDYFAPDGEAEFSYYNYYTKARFRMASIDPIQRGFLKLLPQKFQFFIAHHFATIHTLKVDLVAVKA